MTAGTWEHAGLTCVLRHGFHGIPCGYVLVPEGHPLYRRRYDEQVDGLWLDDLLCVHGGVTFTDFLDDPGEPGREAGWAIGFDMGHPDDFDALLTLNPVRTDDECVAEAELLADQLEALGALAGRLPRLETRTGVAP